MWMSSWKRVRRDYRATLTENKIQYVAAGILACCKAGLPSPAERTARITKGVEKLPALLRHQPRS